MKKTLSVILLAIITISCCGCGVYVSGEKYRVLQRDFEMQISLNQTMKEEMRALREELIVARRELETLRRGAMSKPPSDDAPYAGLEPDDSPSGQPSISPPDENLTPTASSSGGTSSVSSVAGEGTSSVSGASSETSAISSALSETSVISSAPVTDEKAQVKFKDIADALG